MKQQFKRIRTLTEMEQLAGSKGWLMNTTKMQDASSDYFVVAFRTGSKVRGTMLVSGYNGRFFGTAHVAAKGKVKAVVFSSDTTKHDKQPWCKELLGFVYTNDLPPGKRFRLQMGKPSLVNRDDTDAFATGWETVAESERYEGILSEIMEFMNDSENEDSIRTHFFRVLDGKTVISG
jgi:hypothetical protein